MGKFAAEALRTQREAEGADGGMTQRKQPKNEYHIHLERQMTAEKNCPAQKKKKNHPSSHENTRTWGGFGCKGERVGCVGCYH